jgi:hypothetical protein
MASVQDLFGSIRTALESGTVSLAHLGDGSAAVLNLDEPSGLERYAAILRPQIELALRRNGRKQTYLSVLLTGFLIAATALAAYDHLHGRNSASMLIVPGLGVVAVWPLKTLIALNRQALALEVFPGMLPLLNRKQAARLAEQFLAGGMTWNIGAKAAQSSR